MAERYNPKTGLFDDPTKFSQVDEPRTFERHFKYSIAKKPIKLYYKIGFNTRGPWTNNSIKSAYVFDWKDLFKKLGEVYELDELERTYENGNNVVLSIPAEYTLVIGESPTETNQLYQQYNQDSGTEWK